MQPHSFPIFPVDQFHRLIERVQPSEDGISEFKRAERCVIAQPDDALRDSQQVAHTMNKFPIHQLQASFHRICRCDFRSQPPGGSHEIIHAPEHHPRKQQSQGADHQRLLQTDLNEIGNMIEQHQHLPPGKVQGLSNRFRAVGADG
jgi:hypothetical protein